MKQKTKGYSWGNICANVSSRLWCFQSKEDAIKYDPYAVSDEFTME